MTQIDNTVWPPIGARFGVRLGKAYLTLMAYFFISAGALLVITACAKLVSSMGTAQILLKPEPISGVEYRYVFWIVGGVELAVALFCVLGKNNVMKAALIAWLATSFAAYHVGLKQISFAKPCSCFGNLTDALHIDPATANSIALAILTYLVIGSYAILLVNLKSWWQKGLTKNEIGSVSTQDCSE